MRSHDLDFEPLHHPASLDDKDPWPEFAVSAEPAAEQQDLLSIPPQTSVGTLPPPSQVNGAARTFLYHAFKRYLEERPS